MYLKKLKTYSLLALVLILLSILIVDIQDNSLDTPVIILHHVNSTLAYLNNLRISQTLYDTIVCQQILNCLNLYLISFNFGLFFSVFIYLTMYYCLFQLSLCLVRTITLFVTLTILTFSKYHSSNLRAFLRIP